MTSTQGIKKRLRTLENWIQSSQGQAIFDVEMQLFQDQLRQHEPNHYLQLGGPTLMRGFGVQGHYFHVDLRDDFFSPGLSVCADFESLPFADGSMDLVLCPHIHEIYHDQDKLFDEMCRVLSPTGRLLMFGVNMSSLWAIQRVFGESVAPWCPNIVPLGNIIQNMERHDCHVLKRGSFAKVPYGRSHWLKSLPGLGRISYGMPYLGAIYILLFERNVLCFEDGLTHEDGVV